MKCVFLGLKSKIKTTPYSFFHFLCRSSYTCLCNVIPTNVLMNNEGLGNYAAGRYAGLQSSIV